MLTITSKSNSTLGRFSDRVLWRLELGLSLNLLCYCPTTRHRIRVPGWPGRTLSSRYRVLYTGFLFNRWRHWLNNILCQHQDQRKSFIYLFSNWSQRGLNLTRSHFLFFRFLTIWSEVTTGAATFRRFSFPLWDIEYCSSRHLLVLPRSALKMVLGTTRRKHNVRWQHSCQMKDAPFEPATFFLANQNQCGHLRGDGASFGNLSELRYFLITFFFKTG